MTTTVCWPTQPNSRSCAYRAAKMVSASPRQLTRKRRTTEWRPGEVSTRSPGNISTPVLTSWNWPSSTGWKGLLTLAPPTVRTHLHAQHGAIYTQHHHRWCVLGGGAFTATVGMVVAQPCTIAGGRLA